MQRTRDEDYDYLYKVVLVGEAAVGKTHLLSRYIKGTLPKNPTSTIGVEFATRTVPLETGGTVKAQIWDTAGQERYRAITSAHYRRAAGALLVYDVSNERSFSAVTRWMEELKEQAEPDIVIMLVGNKVDLCDRNPEVRKITRETGAKFAKDHGLLFEETSAITVVKVKEAFEGLLQQIYNVKAQSGAGMGKETAANRLAAHLNASQERKSCC